MRGHFDPLGAIDPDLVTERAYRQPEHPRGVGPVAVAASERVNHERPLDLLNRRADQEWNKFIPGTRLRGFLSRTGFSRHGHFRQTPAPIVQADREETARVRVNSERESG